MSFLVCDSIIKNNAEAIYLKYIAVKSYFLKDYDYFKYRGMVSKNFLSGFERKKEFYICVNLHKKYRNLDLIEKLFVLNFVKNKNCWMGSLDHSVLSKFDSYIQSSEYIFKQEIKPLFEDGKYNERFNSSKEFPYTEVFDYYEKGLVKLESLIILNIITGFLDKVYEHHNDFIFEVDYKGVKKYQMFLEYWKVFDILKYKRLVKGFINKQNKQNN